MIKALGQRLGVRPYIRTFHDCCGTKLLRPVPPKKYSLAAWTPTPTTLETDHIPPATAQTATTTNAMRGFVYTAAKKDGRCHYERDDRGEIPQ
jgi:hypothetical protein